MIFIFIGSIGKEGGMEGIIMNTLEGAVRKVASALTSGGPRRAPCAWNPREAVPAGEQSTASGRIIVAIGILNAKDSPPSAAASYLPNGGGRTMGEAPGETYYSDCVDDLQRGIREPGTDIIRDVNRETLEINFTN